MPDIDEIEPQCRYCARLLPFRGSSPKMGELFRCSEGKFDEVIESHETIRHGFS